jgi:uncharacterized membrane protein
MHIDVFDLLFSVQVQEEEKSKWRNTSQDTIHVSWDVWCSANCLTPHSL